MLSESAPKTDRKFEAQVHRNERTRASAQSRGDTVRWFLANSEDVGNIGAMLSLALSVGFRSDRIMFLIFTNENPRQFAVFKAMGAAS
jgi:putative ABC transport system permease protein